MKNALFLSLSLLAATPALAKQPSIYNCRTADGKINVHYTTSSMRGEPTLNVIVDGKNVTVGDDLLVSLNSDGTALGNLVTASVLHKYIADAPSTVYALLVPGIELGNAQSVKFKTVLLVGINGSFRPTPAVYQAVSQTRTVQCVASYAVF